MNKLVKQIIDKLDEAGVDPITLSITKVKLLCKSKKELKKILNDLSK